MNFTQMHERLRLELLRRIERGTASVSLLARQTGFGQSHLSNFLRRHRQLSLEALDRVLAAQHLTAADLLPVLRQAGSLPVDWDEGSIPVVSHHAALFEPHILPSQAQFLLHLPAATLQSLRIPTRIASTRRAWERFVGVRIPAGDALPMDPLVLPDAIAVLDRHYTFLAPYRVNRANLYAIRHGAHLTVRYAEFVSRHLVLRPHNLGYAVELIEVDPDESPYDLISGRVSLILNEP
jgi:hypothetical protein